MTNFTDNEKKAIALAIHLDVEFFIFEGAAYMGNEADARAAYEEWETRQGSGAITEPGFREWLETEGETMPDYEEGGDGCYVVLTDSEADEAAAEYIRESLWAFNPSFLADVTGIDPEVFEAIAANDRCESNNTAIARLVGDDIDSLVEQAIGSDGRAHFLNTYDGEEHEINLHDVTGQNEYLFVYRVN